MNIKLIKGWKDLKVGAYERLIAANFDPTDQDGPFKMAALIYNIPYEDFLDLPLADSQALVKSMEFLQRKPKPIMVKGRYTLNGTEYEFKAEAKEWTTAQYIDFNNTPKDPDKMGDLIAIFLIPKGKSYNKGYDIDKVAEDIRKDLSVSDALAMSDFFTYRWDSLIKRTTTEAKKALKQARKDGAITREEEKKAVEELGQLTDMYGSITLRRSLTSH